MNVSKLSSFETVKNLGNKVSNKIGTYIEKGQAKDTFNKVVSKLEPTGFDNSFIPMASLMITTVLIPRIITAAKRNPDNKEATKDEIAEILFRDVQTILVVLFALKSMNSLISATTTKLSGLPMTNKPYKKLFNSQEKGLTGIKAKATEVIKHPVEKLKILGKNFMDTIHPTAGVHSLSNDEFIRDYSNFESIGDIKKLIEDLPNRGGDQEKVFNKFMDSIIQAQETYLYGNSKAGAKKTMGIIEEANRTAKNGVISKANQENIENAKYILEALRETKQKGVEGFMTNGVSNEDAETQLLHFFKDKNNALVYDAKKLNANLSTLALGIESIYLGFGLPALNQKRLERKYLGEKPIGLDPRVDTYTPLNDKHIKANEIRLYSNFIK